VGMSGERTEKATPRRRQKARQQGQVTRSRDLAGAVAVMAVVVVAGWQRSEILEPWGKLLNEIVEHASLTGGFRYEVYAWTAQAVARAALPAMAMAWFAATLVSVAQGGVVVASEPLAFNWGRLNPVANVKNLFSPSGLSRTLKSLIPFSVVVYLAFGILAREWPVFLRSSWTEPRGLLDLALQLIFEISWKASLVMLVWGAVDYAFQWMTHERSLRMTKQEVKDESKNTEGNPEIRGRVRRLRREMRRKWLMRDVERATVVITNPDEYAVALEYEPERTAAPVVVAKGRNLIAQKIKQFARWKEIPIVENRPLARALYKAVPVGRAIPVSLYTAVAEILAFLYRTQARLQGKTAAAGGKA
jgi:flagellar biosynthetic protein FlhB